jgi:hypothetical protein
VAFLRLLLGYWQLALIWKFLHLDTLHCSIDWLSYFGLRAARASITQCAHFALLSL